MNTDEGLVKKLTEEGTEFVDIKLSDLAGRLHHITFPIERLQTALRQGTGFDGSSLGGFRDVAESDLVVKPDVSRPVTDPFYQRPTVSFYGDIYEPDGKTPFAACPRNILRKVVEYFTEQGIADKIILLPEFEFHLLEEAEFFTGTTASGYALSTREEDTTAGLPKAYHITPPADTTHNLRSEICFLLEEAGIPLKYHHHEVGHYSQVEIETAFLDGSRAGDVIQTIKYVIKNLAREKGMYATFMPKPLAHQSGNGMHTHIQLLKKERNLFASAADANQLSQEAMLFMGGIIQHSRALCALTNPSTNSYRRLQGGMEAPSRVFHSRANRKAALRIPGYVRGAGDLRFEYRVPDGTANPYLALAGILLAGLDGLRKKLDPGPLVTDQPAEDDIRFPYLPGNLDQALLALKQDSEFLTEPGIFPAEVVEKWLRVKKEEIRDIESYPVPAEFVKYFWQ